MVIVDAMAIPRKEAEMDVDFYIWPQIIDVKTRN